MSGEGLIECLLNVTSAVIGQDVTFPETDLTKRLYVLPGSKKSLNSHTNGPVFGLVIGGNFFVVLFNVSWYLSNSLKRLWKCYKINNIFLK